MVPKTSTYVKSYDGKNKWMNFLIKDDELLKNIMILGIKSVIVLKKNMTVNPSTTKNFWKSK